MIATLAMQCADICAAMAIGICAGMITGALVMYQLMREAETDKKAQREVVPNRQDFDADKWIEHYKEITGITEMEGR